MHDTTFGGTATERESKRLHTLHPVPPAPGWRQEVGALKDVEDGLAVALWRALRNVRLWVETEENRERLFNSPSPATQESMGHACAHAPQLIEAFGTFSFLLRAPGSVTGTRIVEACRQVTAWSEARSLLLTAVHFAEAAALADPENPVLANDAGSLCRRAVLYDRSATWFQRAFGLAVRMRKSDLTVSRGESIRALLGYGSLMQFLGRFGEAKGYFERAARRAVGTGRQRLAAGANHDLLTFAAEIGTYQSGLRYATAALDLYPANDRQIPGLAHDWAFLLVRYGYFTPAVPILKLVVDRAQTPSLQALFWGTLARAAAGAGRRELAEEAGQKALAHITVYEEYAPAVLIHLTEAARYLRRWDEAETYAQKAIEAAQRRQTIEPERIARELAQQVLDRTPISPEAEPTDPERLQSFNRRLIARLRQWKAAPASEETEAIPSIRPGETAD